MPEGRKIRMIITIAPIAMGLIAPAKTPLKYSDIKVNINAPAIGP